MKNTQPSPEYSLRVSKRAKYVRLSIKPYVGLEIVIPNRFPRKQIPFILDQHEDWIKAQLKKHSGSFEEVSLPPSLNFHFNNQQIPISYQISNVNKFKELNGTLKIYNRDNKSAFILLRQFIRLKATALLTPMLKDLADRHDFQYNKVQIRSQKSRWGSCSSSGTISLNDQLIFLPQASVHYLMIHELCHTRHMNHSKRFWTLVEKICPQFKQHEGVLKQGRDYVPAWFLKQLYL